MDIRRHYDKNLHVTVWSTGTCPYCRNIERKKVFDYGKMTFREFDQKVEEQTHVVEPLVCSTCGHTFNPYSFVYYEELTKKQISEFVLAYGSEIDAETSEQMEEGHKNRVNIFKEREMEFWDMYGLYACERWEEIVKELNDFEFEEAYKAMNIPHSAKTVAQYRKDVLSRLKTNHERIMFWRLANEYFVREHILEGGFMGLDVERTVKQFGLLRTRFVLLHIPMHESWEIVRTQWIGKLIKQDKKDNRFLFRRITILTNELERLRKKNMHMVRIMEEMKAEMKKLEEKLSLAYQEIKREKREKVKYERDPKDVQKIKTLKSFIDELVGEIHALKEKVKQEDRGQNLPPVKEGLDDSQDQDTDRVHDLDWKPILSGYTIGMIGGFRKIGEEMEYPCRLLVHDGKTKDPIFFQLLKQSDILVVLTQFVSHAAMWEAKTYAVMNDKPIYFVKGLNVEKILKEVANFLSLNKRI